MTQPEDMRNSTSYSYLYNFFWFHSLLHALAQARDRSTDPLGAAVLVVVLACQEEGSGRILETSRQGLSKCNMRLIQFELSSLVLKSISASTCWSNVSSFKTSHRGFGKLGGSFQVGDVDHRHFSLLRKEKALLAVSSMHTEREMNLILTYKQNPSI